MPRLRIAFMTRWNASCGVSQLGELVGRALRKLGHRVLILAPSNDDRLVQHYDEDMVIKCYTIYRSGWREVERDLYPEPFVNCEYDSFIAQGIGFLTCLKQFGSVLQKVRKKSRTIYVIHERLPTKKHSKFTNFFWDAYVCFDQRYKNAFRKIVNGKCWIIPYPYHPIANGDKTKAREKLNLPQDSAIIYSFGWRIKDYIPIIKFISKFGRELRERHLIKYVITADPRRRSPEIEQLKRVKFVELRWEAPTTESLYDYLHAADCLLLYKKESEANKKEVVVSSTIHQCLGSLTPIVINESGFTEPHGREIVKYKDPLKDQTDLFQKLDRLLSDESYVAEIRKEARKVVKRDSPTKIAKKYVELIKACM